MTGRQTKGDKKYPNFNYYNCNFLVVCGIDATSTAAFVFVVAHC